MSLDVCYAQLDDYPRSLGHARLAVMGCMHSRGNARYGVFVLALPEPPYLSPYHCPRRQAHRPGRVVPGDYLPCHLLPITCRA